MRSARGAPSSPTTVVSTPSRLRGELAGFAIVAVASRNCGSAPYIARRAAQPPEHVADVRAEDAAVDVRLVDDDVAEVLEHVAPAVVVREDADMEHVGVGQDQVRPLADLPAPVELGVAVVDRRRARAGRSASASVRSWSCASAFVG